jgi:hypothetical protein
MNTQELVKQLANAKHKTADDFSKAPIAQLQQERASALQMLTELNDAKDSGADLRTAVTFLEDELAALNGEIRNRQDGIQHQAAAALRQFKKSDSGDYETGAVLSPKQSVRSYLQDQGHIKQPEFEGLRLGGLLRAMAVGPRSDLERRALAEGSVIPPEVSRCPISRLRSLSTN